MKTQSRRVYNAINMVPYHTERIFTQDRTWTGSPPFGCVLAIMIFTSPKEILFARTPFLCGKCFHFIFSSIYIFVFATPDRIEVNKKTPTRFSVETAAILMGKAFVVRRTNTSNSVSTFPKKISERRGIFFLPPFENTDKISGRRQRSL